MAPGVVSIYAGLKEVRAGREGVNLPALILPGEDEDVHWNPKPEGLGTPLA